MYSQREEAPEELEPETRLRGISVELVSFICS